MIGFSLAHGSAAVLLLAPLLLALWILSALIVLVRVLVKKRRPYPALLISLCGALLTIGALSIPSNFWQWLFASEFAQSPHSAQLLNYAAVQSQTRTVRRLVDHGVDVTATGHDGETVLHSAAHTGNIDLLRFLVAKRVNLNALDLYGDSPLEVALAHRHSVAASFLQSKGAIRMTGTPEQRRAAIHLIVSKDIERMNQVTAQQHATHGAASQH